jgi:hypothetical protein
LVSEFYDKVKKEENSKYLSKFYETLRILGAGYVSENMEEAHEIFREIYTILLISVDKIGEVKEKISKQINQSEDVSWLWFKREVVAGYVINENMAKFKEWELKTLWDEIKEKAPEKIKEKLKKYCEGIFVVKA